MPAGPRRSGTPVARGGRSSVAAACPTSSPASRWNSSHCRGDAACAPRRRGGSGPAAARASAHPRHLAPRGAGLARRHTVVCPDLRGYGGSSTCHATGPCAAVQGRDGRRLRGPDAPARPRALRGRRPRPRRLRGAARGPRPSRLGGASRCSTRCRSPRRWTAATPASRRPGGTGSSTRSPTGPSAPSMPTPTPGTATRRRSGSGWARRPAPTTAPRSATRPPCTRCWRTTAPAWASTARTTRPTAARGGGRLSRPAAVGPRRRPGAPVRRSAGGLAGLGGRHARPRDALRTPHGRGTAGAARAGTARLPGLRPDGRKPLVRNGRSVHEAGRHREDDVGRSGRPEDGQTRARRRSAPKPVGPGPATFT